MPESDRSQAQAFAEAKVEGFRHDLGPFVVAAETTRMPMVFTDAVAADHPIVFANDSFLALTGYERDEVLGQRFNFILARGADLEAVRQVEEVFAGDDDTAEIRYRRKDGSFFWAAVFISPVKDADGHVVQHFASFVDLTKRRQELAHSEMLIDELNHRVKNTLATVQSVVRQALRSSSDLATVQDSIETRLTALSRSHDLLNRERWEGAWLRDVVTDALKPFGVADGRAERFVIEGPRLRISASATLALGIAVHELATNAVKYGAFSNEAGCVRLAWTIGLSSGGDRLLMRWQEVGGPPVAPPARQGFGSRVIERGLAHELKGRVQLDYPPEGLICTIDVPAPRAARDG